jgi:serine phosphatase RsbU (regulator of sigma subunit)
MPGMIGLDWTGGVFGKLNAGLHLLARDNGYFATGVSLLLDATSGVVRYVNAGHPPPILLRKNGKALFLAEHGPGLGLFEEMVYQEVRATLAVGDTFGGLHGWSRGNLQRGRRRNCRKPD